jgi:hypothetical protein
LEVKLKAHEGQEAKEMEAIRQEVQTVKGLLLSRWDNKKSIQQLSRDFCSGDNDKKSILMQLS